MEKFTGLPRASVNIGRFTELLLGPFAGVKALTIQGALLKRSDTAPL